MKRKILNRLAILLAVIIVTGISSCGKSDQLDVKGLKEMVQKNSKEITTEDIDFFISQTEILVDKVKDMSKEEKKAYVESLDKEEKDCVMAIVMISSAVANSDKKNDMWSEAQLKRIKELNEHLK